jgi:hypothetical protein
MRCDDFGGCRGGGNGYIYLGVGPAMVAGFRVSRAAVMGVLVLGRLESLATWARWRRWIYDALSQARISEEAPHMT